VVRSPWPNYRTPLNAAPSLFLHGGRQRRGASAARSSIWLQHMRLLISTILFTVILAVGCGRSGSYVPTNAVGSQDGAQGLQVVKDVSTNNGVVLTRTAIASGPDPAAAYDSVHDSEKAQAAFSGGTSRASKRLLLSQQVVRRKEIAQPIFGCTSIILVLVFKRNATILTIVPGITAR
jgi:hypothetical protein